MSTWVVLFVLIVKDDKVVVVVEYFFVIVLEYFEKNLFHDNQSVLLPMLDDEQLNLLEHLDHLLMIDN